MFVEKASADLQSKDHVERITAEPGARVGVLGDGQRLSADAEHEPAELHQREVAQKGADSGQNLSCKSGAPWLWQSLTSLDIYPEQIMLDQIVNEFF